jgi:hypothetical protein
MKELQNAVVAMQSAAALLLGFTVVLGVHHYCTKEHTNSFEKKLSMETFEDLRAREIASIIDQNKNIMKAIDDLATSAAKDAFAEKPEEQAKEVMDVGGSQRRCRTFDMTVDDDSVQLELSPRTEIDVMFSRDFDLMQDKEVQRPIVGSAYDGPAMQLNSLERAARRRTLEPLVQENHLQAASSSELPLSARMMEPTDHDLVGYSRQDFVQAPPGLLHGCCCSISGVEQLPNAQQINGMVCTLLQFERDKWLVRLSDGGKARVPAEALRPVRNLPADTVKARIS